MLKSMMAGTIAATLALGVVACTEASPGGEGIDALAGDNLADVLSDNGSLSIIASAMDETGIGSVFEGPASYTIFAPVDEAFDGLEESQETLMSEGGSPVLTAVLRDHMAAGHLTLDALSQAMADADGTLELKTLGGSILTVTELDGQMVIESDGIQARVAGDAAAARNGVIIPIDRILVNTKAD